jgi:hypothetical protein
MHEIEPYYHWRELYTAEEDENSPFYGKQYSEFFYDKKIYNYLIHPQWDEIGSPTLFIKLIFVHYEKKFAVIELLGEWNDCIHNDIMFLKREAADYLIDNGINKFILIGENILNFHHDDTDYYEEWLSDVENGWISLINIRDHIQEEMKKVYLQHYLFFGNTLNNINWRNYDPVTLFRLIDKMINQRFCE